MAESQSVDDFVDKRGHKPRERRCVATQISRDPQDMIRFVTSPDNVLVPDVKGKLPGRGVYVTASRAALEKAIKTGAFSRGLKTKITIPEDLVDQVEAALRRYVLSLIAMAKKSGKLILGFDQVYDYARSNVITWRVEAKDGSPDGRGKIRTVSKAVARELEQNLPSVLGCFTSLELGQILGREKVVHGAIASGKFATGFTSQVKRLSGFCEIVPNAWPDYEHEMRGVKLDEAGMDETS